MNHFLLSNSSTSYVSPIEVARAVERYATKFQVASTKVISYQTRVSLAIQIKLRFSVRLMSLVRIRCWPRECPLIGTTSPLLSLFNFNSERVSLRSPRQRGVGMFEIKVRGSPCHLAELHVVVSPPLLKLKLEQRLWLSPLLLKISLLILFASLTPKFSSFNPSLPLLID
ncbi:hypothetical protein ACFX19_030302 [Malus domestica]